MYRKKGGNKAPQTQKGIFSMADEIFDAQDLITLTDEEGNEEQFEVIASLEIDGVMYYALMPVADNENGEEILSTIEDDDEYERVADAFDDEVFSEIDYD